MKELLDNLYTEIVNLDTQMGQLRRQHKKCIKLYLKLMRKLS